MTFYNIIFGILFLGACREFFQAGLNRKWKDFCIASTLALLVFNDTLFTSHEIESLNLKYTIGMKLVDLFAFLILTMAIALFNTTSNILGIKINGKIFTHWREPIIWGLICFYWLLALIWNKLGNIYSYQVGYREEIAITLLFFFYLMLIVSINPLKRATKFIRWFIPLVVFGYILYKAFTYY
jgi:hypothetical protein